MEIRKQTHVTISLNEVTAIVKEKLGLVGEVILTVYSGPTQDKEESTGDWKAVPPDWKMPYCPETLGCTIEVEYRDGERATGPSRYWGVTWRQDGKDWDIVKYRRLGSAQAQAQM